MKASVFFSLCFTTAFLASAISVTSGQFKDESDNEPLPPIWVAPDNHGYMKPVLQEIATEKPLIGRPDGHEPIANDGQSLIGRPDGHELNKQTEMPPLIGRPDGHDGGSHSLIGRPDGHEPNYQTAMPSTDTTDEDDLTSEEVISDDDNYDMYNEDGDYDDDDEDDEPLIRCKRPMCRMFCSFGFQTDETGCPVCRCLEDPCKDVSCDEGSICHSLQCTDQRSCTKLSANCIPLARSCPEPMCANYCLNGYQHNKEGCMTCDCEGRTEPESSDIKELPCPEPMCTSLCAGGYQTNSRGCMTCMCVNDSKSTIDTCSTLVCELGQICRTTQTANEDGSFNSVIVCAPKPLCQLAQEMAAMKRGRDQSSVNAASWMFVPECEQTGSFKPMQCHDKKEPECFCVDDRGKEIDGSRKLILSDDDKPQCAPNVTMTVHINMVLESNDDVGEDDYDDDDDDDEDSSFNSDFLKGTFEEDVSSWLLIEKQYITVIKADGTSSKKRITVELEISNDGVSDLPSAVEHMKRKILMGHCKFPVRSVVFTPVIEKLDVQHKYNVNQVKTASSISDPPADIPVACHYTVYICFEDYHIILAVSVMLLLFIFLAVFSVTMVHRRRTRYNSMQFRHHKLENQYSHEQKNFVEGEVAIEVANESLILVSSEKKIPIA